MRALRLNTQLQCVGKATIKAKYDIVLINESCNLTKNINLSLFKALEIAR